LRDILNDGKRMPVDQVIDIVAQVATGLAYAHEHDIVHRDVKPSNIMVVRDGHVKITDFGIARMASASVRTQTGMVLGSPKYMSPEQVMGKLTDQRSDIFSLGVMLYEMLTGQAPFTGENVNAIMYQTLNAVPPPPSTLSPAVPEMLNFIVAKALAKDLDDRYQDAKEFANDLRACRDRMPRSAASLDVGKSQAAATVQLEAIPAARHVDSREDESKPVAAGLSSAFDSAAATMRLAALTGTSEDLEDLSKTFKMPIPSMEEINRVATVMPSAAKIKAAPPDFSKPKAPPAAPASKQQEDEEVGNGGNLLFIVIVVLVLVGLLSVFMF
jgi:eukaryotic-like serine/threonine-protein kinase